MSKKKREREREKVSLHTFLATSTKMLLLKPSVVVIARSNVILVGRVISAMARGKVMGVWIYFVPVNVLLSCPFIQYVRVVSSGCRVVVFLC